LSFAKAPQQARVIVSLADNQHQGIVPIPSKLGNGQDPFNNLYWGALYGAKTYFKRKSAWSLKSTNLNHTAILDAFELGHDAYPSAKITFEAWDGAKQKQAVKAYLSDLRDSKSDNQLVCFVGHNALMDLFVANIPALKETQSSNQNRHRKGAVIACRSASYFEPHHDALGVESYVMTRGLMAPEAYVLDGFLLSWLKGLSSNSARLEAAKKYAEYQKIPIRNANWLFGVKP